MQTDTFDQSRTVVVSGVPDVLSSSRMIDKLTIHFQRRKRSDGGDVEAVQYPTNMHGVAFVTFDEPEDAERVVRKEEHIMIDDEFPADYLLTVFPFTTDVFLYVPKATVDLSVFGSDQASLIQSLQSAHRSLRFRPLLHKRKATIEGPFAAVQALRNDLIRRASQLKSTDSARTAPDKIRETPLNPRVISHPEFVDSVSRSRSKAKLEPANSLSTGLQTTGEATEVESSLLNAETLNASWSPEVQERGCAEGGFGDTDSDEVDQEQNGVEISSEFRNKQRLKEGRKSPSLSGMFLQKEAAKLKQKHTADTDWTSARKTQKETHLDYKLSNTRSPEESDQRVSPHLSHNMLRDVSKPPERNTEEHLEENCTWVDLNMFLYMKKFAKDEFDKCLRGLEASFETVEGSDLVKVILTEKQTSEETSGIQRGLDDLQFLVQAWTLTLRVHEIDLKDEGDLNKQEVMQICDDVNFLFGDVLYTFEGSRIKAVGPSAASYLFTRFVQRRIAELEDKSLGK
ncbi:uncharacterized protein LOC117808021 [Xyrichtys novacula]|uniref:Uncharacterized protein LOC117808021 n=1 Tax=Xyrichtys novacula TaxID=13765 RepID=A0AAV1HNI9_XYRNO|nr:uncharacterized protein LOC117808021 [Xyrichtys novacula]